VLLLLFTALFYSGNAEYNTGLGIAAGMCVFEFIWEYIGRNAVMKERRWQLNVFILLGILSPVWIILFGVKFNDAFDGCLPTLSLLLFD
jgi:hypothetical protein